LMKLIAFFAVSFLAFAAKSESPTGSRTTPPVISSVAPMGVSRGTTAELTVEGLNLGKTSAIYLSEPGIKARVLHVKELPDQSDVRLGSNGTVSTVDLGPLPPRNLVTIELEISPEAVIGPVSFRLQTPLGTTPASKFMIEPYYGEAPDKEPNDTPEDAFETFLPAILVGTISKPGDVDYYKIAVSAGEQLVFENTGKTLGSALQPLVSIYDSNQKLVKEFGEAGGRDANVFAQTFDKAGTYYVRLSDFEESGGAKNFYRIKVGKLPIAISAFPLGVERGKTAAIALHGYNLGAAKIDVKGEPSPEDPDAMLIRPNGKSGLAFDRVRLAVGDEPEVMATGKNPQPVQLPVTINGKLLAPYNDFKFHARKGQKLIVDVNAARLGSPLDSFVEVLDAVGKPIERATVRCLLETTTTLRDHDSAGAGIRLTSPAGFKPGDYAMIGSEIIQVAAMPLSPDNDFTFDSFGGQRLAFFDTSSEAHALDQPVYKVEIAPPGKRFPPNGLPIAHLTYRNDDGGPGYGKDSRLHFTAPADGDYIVRLRDVRGLKGDDYSYRLKIREPAPSYRLSVNPRNPNVPLGGRIPLTVTAMRMDDHNAPIHVSIKNLPVGFRATDGVIASGQVSTTLLLSADASATLAQAVPLVVADDKGQQASPEDKLKLISLMPRPDIQMAAVTKEVVLRPGGKAQVEVAIQRNNDFAGRVPVDVRNLPIGVRVIDVGLNGVLINENEDKRSFTLEAEPDAPATEQPIAVSGVIETRAAGQQNAYAAEPIKLRVAVK
ncbi:MAG: PPC domain-containing protein, partial [Acidobacteriota bacterium]|nr:PPC domain-containing protein [Acidobacteriota bacterium]